MGLLNNWDVHLGGTVSQLTKSFCDRCTRGGPAMAGSRGFYPWGGFNSDSRRPVSGGFWVNLGYNDEGKSHSAYYGPYVNFRLSSQFQLNLGTNFSTSQDNTQWFGNFVDASNVTHYSFAHLDQSTTSMSVRLNYTMTP